MKAVSSYEELLQKTGKETMKVNRLRILTGKKHRQIKLLRLEKVQIWVFGLLVY